MGNYYNSAMSEELEKRVEALEKQVSQLSGRLESEGRIWCQNAEVMDWNIDNCRLHIDWLNFRVNLMKNIGVFKNLWIDEEWITGNNEHREKIRAHEEKLPAE